MQAKRYQAKTIKEAIGRVKNILGPDAMIISTKKIGGKPGNSLVEVAAVPAGDNVSPQGRSSFGEVKSELMSIKEMICLLNHSGAIIERLLMSPALLSLYAKLINSGVRDQYAKLFLERAGALEEHPPERVDHIRENTIREIMRVIGVKNPFGEKEKNRVIAAFVGTTGVGKTTTIAKLAAQLMLKAKKRVGLISIDNYRIGAMEQLKTYATILGIPCYPAFSRKDLLFALKRLEGREVVLVDTAGQSQYDHAKIEELRQTIMPDLDMSCHLLLSVPTTESEMSKTAINFGPINFQSYIFTKTDEAEKCGSILNQIMKLNLPVSYITVGQSVPEDIEPASKKRILNLVLNKN